MSEEVNRLISFDALALVPLVVLAVHVVFVATRDWRAIAIFHGAGVLNFAAELGMLHGGPRFVEAGTAETLLVLFELSWLDLGLFCSLGWVFVRKAHLGSSTPRWAIVTLALLFFVGLPLASTPWGIWDGAILTRRLVAHPLAQPLAQVGVVVVAGALLLWRREPRLLGWLVLFGALLGVGFQGRLFWAGIRQASTASGPVMVVDTLTLATMPLVAGGLLLSWIAKRRSAP